jgi:hypothetical protein
MFCSAVGAAPLEPLPSVSYLADDCDAAWNDFGFCNPAGPTGSFDIWLARSTDGGATWTTPTLITYTIDDEYFSRLVSTTGARLSLHTNHAVVETEQEFCRTNRIGEFDHEADIP